MCRPSREESDSVRVRRSEAGTSALVNVDLPTPDPAKIEQRAEEEVPLDDIVETWPVGTDPETHIACLNKLFDKIAWCQHYPTASDPEMARCWCRNCRCACGGTTGAASRRGHHIHAKASASARGPWRDSS